MSDPTVARTEARDGERSVRRSTSTGFFTWWDDEGNIDVGTVLEEFRWRW